MKFSKKYLLISGVILLIGIGAIYKFYPKKEIVKPVAPTISVNEKKERFRTLIVPAVDAVYTKLMELYEDVKSQVEAGKTSHNIETLKEQYAVSTDQELLMALKPFPRSIAIAQAAMESSWATSRFFNEANNIFGVWSFNENEPRIAALKKREGKTIWLKKYASIEDAITDYYRILAKGRAYTAFRKAKMQTNDPYVLVTKLDNYSEKGSEYGKELASIIRFNKFDAYDK